MEIFMIFLILIITECSFIKGQQTKNENGTAKTIETEKYLTTAIASLSTNENSGIKSFAFSTNEDVPLNVTYRVYYFNFRGRGEPIRLLLHYVGVLFDDYQIQHEEWISKYKTETPYGHIPLLEEIHNGGRKLAESFAILRYLARKHDLANGVLKNKSGKNQRDDTWAEAKVDEFADFHNDVANDFHDLLFPSNPSDLLNLITAKQLSNKYFPVYYRQLRNSFKAHKTGFLFGALTWVDFLVADFFESVKRLYPSVISAFPRITRYHQRVYSLPQLKKYLKQRKF